MHLESNLNPNNDSFTPSHRGGTSICVVIVVASASSSYSSSSAAVAAGNGSGDAAAAIAYGLVLCHQQPLYYKSRQLIIVIIMTERSRQNHEFLSLFFRIKCCIYVDCFKKKFVFTSPIMVDHCK